MLEPFADLLAPLSALEIALAGGTVLVAGFLRGFVGFGAALMIIMVLSVILGPLTAVPVAAFAGLAPTIQLLPTAIRESEPPVVLPFSLGAFLGAPLGALVLVTIDPSLMRMAISGFVLAMVAVLYSGWHLRRRPGRAVLTGAGAAAGFVQGSAGVSGPLAVVVMLSQAGAAVQQRANVIGTLTALNFCSLLPFWYHGLFTNEVILFALLIVPLYCFSIWLGARYFGASGSKYFRNAAMAALAVIGIVTMVMAVRDYMAV